AHEMSEPFDANALRTRLQVPVWRTSKHEMDTLDRQSRASVCLQESVEIFVSAPIPRIEDIREGQAEALCHVEEELGYTIVDYVHVVRPHPGPFQELPPRVFGHADYSAAFPIEALHESVIVGSVQSGIEMEVRQIVHS